jgi:hypothetical protein
MASLPATPKTSKAPISARDRLRARTNYGPRRFTGFAPVPLACFADIPRLSSGAACQQLLYLSLALSLGQRVQENQPFCEVTEERTTAEWAELCGCDERTFQREILGLAQRRVIEYKQRKKGVWEITPLFRTWDKLEDYKPGPTPEPEPEPEPDEDQDAAAKQATITRLTEKPVAVRAGGVSRKIKAECGISDIQVSSNLDIHFEAVVQGGSLHLKFIGPQFKAESGNGLQKTKGIQANGRHGRRILHPRAPEVAGLFDPFVYRSCQKTLSADESAWKECCELVSDVPNTLLVKQVVERAARPINSPRACIAICREIAANYEKSKNLPPAKRDPRNITQEDMDRMIAAERLRAKQRRQA